ncbi:hypothetical protein EMCRGX_G010332 [Ephydatia muelleri]
MKELLSVPLRHGHSITKITAQMYRSQFGGSIALSSHSDTKSFHLLMGICYEHRQNAVGCLKLDSMDAIRDVHTKVAADECHVASEALIVMAQPYDNINYLPIPLIIIPSCKSSHFSTSSHVLTFTMLHLEYLGPKYGGFDLKHICKRFCTLCIVQRGEFFVLGDTVTRSDLQELVAAAGHDNISIKSMFFQNDKQNVPVTTVYWNVIQIQLSGNEQDCHIHQQGTYAGESMFGHMRTLTHNRNFNLAEANFNLSTAHQISLILEEHPEWSRGHRLLKATEDKVNPLSWRGDMKVTKHLDIPALHNQGIEQAKAVIVASGLL